MAVNFDIENQISQIMKLGRDVSAPNLHALEMTPGETVVLTFAHRFDMHSLARVEKEREAWVLLFRDEHMPGITFYLPESYSLEIAGKALSEMQKEKGENGETLQPPVVLIRRMGEKKIRPEFSPIKIYRVNILGRLGDDLHDGDRKIILNSETITTMCLSLNPAISYLLVAKEAAQMGMLPEKPAKLALRAAGPPAKDVEVTDKKRRELNSKAS